MAKPDGEDGGNESDSTRKQRWPDEIVNYLRLVQRTFENEPKKYHEFLRILVDRKHRRISVAHLIEEVWSLFEGHNELINEFYQFLPKKYRGKGGTSLEDATNFVIKLKARFLHDPEVYAAFLQILNKCRRGACDAQHTFQAVKDLFKGHPDLIEEYQKYLPPRSVM
ncbi:Paired amphipathic helix protein Sin3-like 1 [Carex littledalei]|uniref:Paired amphipathic helix protein Sin3-like 1 n=1 Tax=Carex littledalei TaxID=544730 RepID=A0A833R3G9_9POAL|nr:Paired amphipathic helix protein Sin3-like 1 [Carex littledalei]